MADVHVVITKMGNTNDIIVDPVQMPVLEEEFVIWHISSDHDKVEKVNITFEDGNDKFFEIMDYGGNVQQTPSYTKELTTRNVPTATPGKAMAAGAVLRLTKKTLIWGRAPVSNVDPKVCKYTVKALCSSGTPDFEIDPVILTTKPRG